MQPIDQLIYSSIYAEFPETILHLELAAACARADKRKANEAMRHCASVRSKIVMNKHLQRTLKEMSISIMPITQLCSLKHCLDKMRTELERQLKSDNIELVDAIAMMKQETLLMIK